MKTFLVLLYSLVLVSVTACSQSSVSVKPAPKFLDSSHIGTLLAVPKPMGWTSDYAGLFTKEQVFQLDSMLSSWEKKTSSEIAVLTLSIDLADSLEMDRYSLRVMNEWGVGKADQKNGILILIAPNSRRLRIQNGYGVEAKLTDGETLSIVNTIMIPAFREGKFYEGTRAAIQEIQKQLY